MSGRDYVIPDDVRELAPTILAHRLLPTVEAAMNGRGPGDILATALDAVPITEVAPAPSARSGSASR
jgi:MoxR-like ATPase